MQWFCSDTMTAGRKDFGLAPSMTPRTLVSDIVILADQVRDTPLVIYA